MQKLKEFVSQPVVIDAGISVTGNTLAAVLSGVSLILISRALGPESFGVISVAFSLMLIVAKVAEGGFNSVLIKFMPIVSVTERSELFWFTSTAKATLGLITGVALSLLSPFLSSLLHIPITIILVVAWFNLIILGYEHLATVLTALLKIRHAIFGNILQASCKIIIGIGVMMATSLSGVFVFFLYMVAPTPTILYFFRNLPSSLLKKPRVLEWQSQWMRSRAMAVNNWVAGLSGALAQNSDIFVVSMLLPGLAVGYMGAAMRLTMFFALFGYSLAGVLNPRVAKLESAVAVSSYWKQASLFLGFSVVAAIVLPIFSWILIFLSAGPDYLEAVPVMQWLLSATCLAIGTTGMSALFFRYNQPGYFSVVAILQSVLILAGSVLLIPSFGLISVGWVRMGSQLSVTLLTIAWALYAHHKTFGLMPWEN